MTGALIFTSLINLTSYLILILILQYLCNAHLRLSNKNLILCSLSALFFIVATQFFCSEQFGFYLIFILYYATILILSYKRFTDILLSFIAMLIYTSLGVIPTMMLKSLPITLNDNITIFGVHTTLSSSGLDIIMLASLLFLRNILHKYHISLKFNFKEILLSLLMIYLAFMALVFMYLNNASSRKVTLASSFWSIFLLIAFLVSIIYYVYIIVESRIKLYHEYVERSQITYLTTQLDALQYLKEKEDSTRKLRHDFNKHLSVIQTLCVEGRFDEVRAYSAELSSTFPTASTPISGNNIADTILTTRKKIAEDNSISFTYEGSLSRLDILSAPEICSLLANAYDNAIEACSKQTNAFIHTKANTTNHFTSIEIRNSVNKKPRIHGNRIATTKPDKKNHGYGIAIMEQIVKKYHGQLTISSTKSEFILKIILRHN